MRLFVGGSLILGRGIDQILLNPGSPKMEWLPRNSSLLYIEESVKLHGEFPNATETASPDYLWEYISKEFREQAPMVKIANLESSISSDKSLHMNDLSQSTSTKVDYLQLNPQNSYILQSLDIDILTLANDHVLDFGLPGFSETISSLDVQNIGYIGGGMNIEEAKRLGIKEVTLLTEGDQMMEEEGETTEARVLILSVLDTSSGCGAACAAGLHRQGLFQINISNPKALESIKTIIDSVKLDNDIIIIYLHYGVQWGWGISQEFIEFTHQLIDQIDINIIVNTAPWHLRPVEVYKGKLILHGVGSLITDLEGFSNPEFNPAAGGLFFVKIDSKNGELKGLKIVPTTMVHFRPQPATKEHTQFVLQILNERGKQFGTTFRWEIPSNIFRLNLNQTI